MPPPEKCCVCGDTRHRDYDHLAACIKAVADKREVKGG